MEKYQMSSEKLKTEEELELKYQPQFIGSIK